MSINMFLKVIVFHLKIFFLIFDGICLVLSQADLDITEINKLTAEAIQTPLKSSRSEYFSKFLIELREVRPGWLAGSSGRPR